MLVLGIETSCDDTSCSVVEDGRKVLSNVTSSSLRYHRRYRGIIPEIASREHLKCIERLCCICLKEAKIKFQNIDLVAVTNGPGLVGSLLVGVCFAKALSFSIPCSLIGINHVKAHLYPVFFKKRKPRFPFIGLVVSGGHTSLYLVNSFNSYRILGQTQDDAAGEAFDKVAKILKLGYPGGPIIENLAKAGDSNKITFSCKRLHNSLDFSFSGIKTACLYYTQKNHPNGKQKKDIAASFQKSVIDILMDKSFKACEKNRIYQLVVGGGVASNSYLRKRFQRYALPLKVKLYFPEKKFCLDNAAMVAGLGYQLFKKGKHSNLFLEPCI